MITHDQADDLRALYPAEDVAREELDYEKLWNGLKSQMRAQGLDIMLFRMKQLEIAQRESKNA